MWDSSQTLRRLSNPDRQKFQEMSEDFIKKLFILSGNQ